MRKRGLLCVTVGGWVGVYVYGGGGGNLVWRRAAVVDFVIPDPGTRILDAYKQWREVRACARPCARALVRCTHCSSSLLRV